MKLLLLVATLALWSAPDDAEIELRIEEQLAAFEGGWAKVPPLASSLASLGPAATPILLDRWISSTPATDADRTPGASEVQLSTALQLALNQLPIAGLRDAIDQIARPGARPTEVLAALELLGRIGDPGDLERVAALATAGGDPNLEVRRAYEHAVLSLIDGEDTARISFCRRLPDLRPRLISSAVNAVTATGGAGAFEALSGGLGRRADGPILLSLARLADRPDLRPSEESLAAVERSLAEADPAVVALAAEVLADLQAIEAAPALIEALRRADGRHRPCLADRLFVLTRADLGTDPRAWERWHAKEMRWLASEASSLEWDLQRGPSRQARVALQALASHPLHRRALASALLYGLERPEDDIVEAACTALAAYDAQPAIGRLAALLEHPSSGVRNAAWQALRSLSDLDLPQDPDAWKAALSDYDRLSEEPR
ncbi:MAG: hypothetical protein AAFZ65_02130 [Planctomycetota bacterium]